MLHAPSAAELRTAFSSRCVESQPRSGGSIGASSDSFFSASLSCPCGTKSALHAKPQAAPPPPPAAQAPTVAVARVNRQDLYNEDAMTAEFRPYEEVELHAKVSGFVREMNVDFGDRVKAGQSAGHAGGSGTAGRTPQRHRHRTESRGGLHQRPPDLQAACGGEQSNIPTWSRSRTSTRPKPRTAPPRRPSPPPKPTWTNSTRWWPTRTSSRRLTA